MKDHVPGQIVRGQILAGVGVLVLALAAVGCGESEPVFTGEVASRLVEERFPDSEVDVGSARMEDGMGAVGAVLDGATVQFFFEPPPAAGGEWELVEVEHEGSRFSVGDLEQISETMVSMAEIATALARYQQEHGTYPIGESSDALALLVPDYLPDGTEFDDAWLQSYRYTSTDGETYTLISHGPDNAVATRDDIVLHTGEFVSRERD